MDRLLLILQNTVNAKARLVKSQREAAVWPYLNLPYTLVDP